MLKNGKKSTSICTKTRGKNCALLQSCKNRKKLCQNLKKNGVLNTYIYGGANYTLGSPVATTLFSERTVTPSLADESVNRLRSVC